MITEVRNLPPIVKTARLLRYQVELAVRRMARANRFDVGADLPRDAREVIRTCAAAWRDRARKLDRVQALSEAVDEFKLSLQLAQDIRAFASFGQFEEVATTARSLGRQVGGWLKQLHLNGQNRPATEPDGRALSLSSRTASPTEARP